MAEPLLGWVDPADRTQAQNDAHEAATAKMVKFSLPVPQLAKGDKVLLTDLWKHPDVIADVGFPFQRSHQLTGSCVNSGFWNAVVSTICSQRVAADKPTKAFVPFTLHNYAMSRHYMGDDGQGEGSLGSTIAASATKDGVRDWVPGTDGMPEYTRGDGDGFKVSSSVEMSWSSVRNPNVNKILPTSRNHLFGSAAECKSPTDIQAMVTNGKGVAFACSYYVGSAEIKGSGANACVVGKWNGRGGHQQSVHGAWNHPDLGMLYAVGNNWDKNTYPADPAGLPWCFCWVPEDNLVWAMSQSGEVYGYSNLPWFEAMPKVLNWMDV